VPVRSGGSENKLRANLRNEEVWCACSAIVSLASGLDFEAKTIVSTPRSSRFYLAHASIGFHASLFKSHDALLLSTLSEAVPESLRDRRPSPLLCSNTYD
jgi:hypothetical protein